MLGDVKEAGDFGGEAAVLVVDEGIEEAGLAVEGGDVVVGDGGGDEGAVPFPEQDLLAGAAHAELAVALKTHGDDEAVVLNEVAVERLRELHDAHIEIGGVDNLDGTVVGVIILRAVVLFYMVVEGLGG